MTVRYCSKIRNTSGKIIGYNIENDSGKIIYISAEDLKKAILNNKLAVSNLRLTSDGRLIDSFNGASTDSKSIKHTQQNSDNNVIDEYISNLIKKAKFLGYDVYPIKTLCNHYYYTVHLPNNNFALCIPSDVVDISQNSFVTDYSGNINQISGDLKVIGGSGLVYAKNLFSDCEAKSIDFSNFITSNIVDMSAMFSGCATPLLDLHKFDTHNVINMSCMFWHCQATSINLKSFNTSKVVNMDRMFNSCLASKLDLRSFDTRNVEAMDAMFLGSKAKYLDLSSFSLNKITNPHMAFIGITGTLLNADKTDYTIVALHTVSRRIERDTGD